MLLDTYESQGLLFNSNFKETTTSGDMQAYRGDLVLIEGEVADAMGRRKPPLAVMVGAVMLAAADKLKFVAGSLDEIAQLDAFVEKYRGDFAADMGALLYVVNIAKPMRVESAGIDFVLIPLTDGLVWNELVDELKLDKSDFKGQSSADKILTLYRAWLDYRSRQPSVPLAEAKTLITDAKRAIHGAV